MKKTFLALVSLAVAAMMVACGGKKSENVEAEQENAESVALEETDEENQEQASEAKAELQLTIDSVIPEDMKAVYANGDFMPGPAVFFKDNLSGEKVGEFPSKWDIDNGSAEVAEFNDRLVINLANNDARLLPKVVGDSKNYLPEVFTIEFEYYCNGEEDFNACYHLLFNGASDEYLGEITLATEDNIHWSLFKQNDEEISGDYAKLATVEKKDSWNHFALSYDKGTVKLYVNGTRAVSLPNIKAPGYFVIGGEGWEDHRYYFTNVRMGTVVNSEE